MKKIITPLILFFAALLAGGCSKWLDVKPEDKITEEQQFATAEGFYGALNGIYLDMLKPALYGSQLSVEMTEVLAQRYNIGQQHTLITVKEYRYGENPAKNKIAAIWNNMYLQILNINRMMMYIDKKSGVLRNDQHDLIKGEALALRAYFHFDLLRLFGPVYNSADSVKECIPYYDAFSVTYNPLLPATQVLDKVQQDINAAFTLLAADPVITKGPGNQMTEEAAQGRYRSLRLNYYALRLLAARVCLYRNDKAGALAHARVVTAAQAKWYPFVTHQQIVLDKQNPDRVFSTEVLFGMQNIRRLEGYNGLFAPEQTDDNYLSMLPTRLGEVFENNENDYRYNPIWILPANGIRADRAFYKYAPIKLPNLFHSYLMPLMRVSEAYYIAAECESDPATAVAALNMVRRNRNLPDLPLNADLQEELKKEYRREFIGEGQLFFFYKRKKITDLPNASATSGNVTMQPVLPLPESEFLYR